MLLFSDGVDNLVAGDLVFHRESPCKEPPAEVLGALLSDKIDPHIEAILGHEVGSNWLGHDGNKAVEILGNLLGGTNVQRLSMTTDPPISLDSETDEFYIDDTSIILCDIFNSHLHASNYSGTNS